jgi:hypothetical protein
LLFGVGVGVDSDSDSSTGTDGNDNNVIPDPAVDWRSFILKIEALLQDEWDQWNPIKRKMAPWIDTKALEKAYCKKPGVFSSFRGRRQSLV